MSLIKSPGRLKAAEAAQVVCMYAHSDDLLGSHPKRLPIAAASAEVGAFSAIISHAILCSEEDVASETTE